MAHLTDGELAIRKGARAIAKLEKEVEAFAFNVSNSGRSRRSQRKLSLSL